MDLLTVSAKTNIETKKILEALEIVSEGKISFVDLVKRSGFSIESIKQLKNRAPSLFLPIPNFLILSEAGKRFVASEKSKLFIFSPEHENEIRRIFEKYEKARPDPERNYDQFYATVETQIERVRLFCEQNDVRNSQILFLGDDDLTSLAVSVLSAFVRVAVVDVDQRQLSFIEKVARSEGMKIELYLNDLREGLLPELHNRFDIVFTDPPYTPEGFELFLARELEAVKRKFGTLYICYGTSERSYERVLPIQETICKYGLGIDAVLTGFNRYEGAEPIGNSSSVYVLKVNPRTASPRGAALKRSIYTYE